MTCESAREAKLRHESALQSLEIESKFGNYYNGKQVKQIHQGDIGN